MLPLYVAGIENIQDAMNGRIDVWRWCKNLSLGRDSHYIEAQHLLSMRTQDKIKQAIIKTAIPG